jgi:hypothetical protein
MQIITYFCNLLIIKDITLKELLFVLTVIFISTGCKGPLSAPAAAEAKQGIHKVVVNEVIQAGGYTYLNVSEKRKKTWIAVPATQAVKGDQFYYSGGLEMTDFFSKELNRTFPSVLFLEGISKEPTTGGITVMNQTTSPGRVVTEKINITIEPGEGCITIAKLIAEKAAYSEKTVRIKGKIVKFNQAIMDKNWVHLQDGSEFNGVFDLTITTDSQVTVGDIVTFEGKIILNKDFGYGYFYDVLMEGGKLIK